jgi:AAA+ ATPase superfamily predicted ATPase
MIFGQRRIGKTSLLKEMVRTYPNTVQIGASHSLLLPWVC